VSVGKKIVDGARAGIGSLLDKITAGETPLSGVVSLELEREREARKALRARRGDGPPESNPLARDAAGGAEAARRRGQIAAARARSLGAAKAARRAEAEKAARAAAEAAAAAATRERAASQARSEEDFRKFRDDVKSGRVKPGAGPSSSGAGASSASGAGGGSSRPGGFSGFGRNDKIDKAYRTLDLPVGASFAEVKTQYRKLMRKYHPDMHSAASAGKQKAANELSMQVTQAYNLLDEHLNRK
jgi:DnaJ-domain-containing protein 1